MKEIELLYDAVHSDYGIEIEVFEDHLLATNHLATARAKNPDFRNIQISRSPKNPNCLWLIKVQKEEPKRKTLNENPKGEGPLFSLADLLGDD